jgi:ABC-type transport system involved in multi-copper enzyme maturation permease subunit
MWLLIRKDLILDRRVTVLNFGFYLLLLPIYASLVEWVPPTAYAVFAAVVSAILPLTLVAREDKYGTAALSCSLPVTRNQIVASRYVGGWLVTLAATLVLVGVAFLLPWTQFAQRGGFPASALLAAFVVIGLVMAGLLPFTLRFGLAGLVGFLVGTQVLGMVAFMSALMLSDHATRRNVIATVAETVRALRELGGSFAFAVALAMGVVLLNLASYRLSCWIFRRREL